jgi:hypothetical protein
MASDRDILSDAIERFRLADEGSAFNRDAAEDDIKFARLGEQWSEEMLKQRRAEGRPALTINRLPAFIRQVVNDARQNKPGIAVKPVDNVGDEDTAEVIGGLIRSVERHSRASVAYDTAIEHAVTCGVGYFTIDIDYAHPDSFDLEAFIRRVPNPLMVHADPNSTEFDSSDWEYGFLSDMLTEDEFKSRYPDAEPVDFVGDDRDAAMAWTDGDKVRIAQYWLRERVKRKLVQGRFFDPLDGTPGPVIAIRESDLDGYIDKLSEEAGSDMRSLFSVIREREVDAWKVKRRTMSGTQILDEDDWPGQTIPICPVYGEEVIVEGRRHLRSMIRDAKDPQRMFNFWRSATTELVALAPRAPWVMPSGALPQKGEELAKWATANTRSHAYLTFDGNQPPRREAFAGVPAGAIQEALSAADDIKAITGIYDPSLGARSNETSGRAIIARQRESDVSNFHFQDNLNRAIEGAGRILVEIIPSVYGPRETVRILGEDQAEKVVDLVSAGTGSVTQPGVDGEPRLYDLNAGHYDVVVRAGPSYQTQREEQREVMTNIVQARPDLLTIIGDQLFEAMDFPGADKIAERLRLMLPPQIAQAEGIAPPQQMQPGMAPAGPPQQPMGMPMQGGGPASPMTPVGPMGRPPQQF